MDNNQLDIIVKAQNLASGELAALSGQVSGLEAKAASAGAAFNVMKLAMVAAAVGVAAVGVVAVKAAANFQEGMTTLVTGAGEAESNIKLVSAGILGLATSTGTTTKQLTDGMFMIESAGFHGAAGLDVLKAAAEGAKVGNADLGIVADATTTILKDFGDTGITASGAVNTLIATVANGKTHMSDLAESLSQVLPTASAAKIGLNDVMGAMATMTGEGVPAANAATYLRQTILGLIAPSSGAKKALEEVGLTSSAVSEEMQKSLPDTLKMITEAVGKKFPEGSAQYVEAIKNISGGAKTMQGMLDLTGQHLSDFTANVKIVGDSVTGAGGKINGWANVQEDFNFKLSKANEIVQTSLIQIGTYLLPVLSTVVGAFTDWYNAVGGLTGIFDPLINGIMTIATQVGDYLAPKFETLWKSIQTNIIPIIKDLWQNVILPLIPVLGVLLVGAIGLVVDAYTKMSDGIGWVINAITTGNPIIIGLTTAFTVLAGVMAFNAVFDALTVGFTTFSLVTIPSVVASFDTIAASSAGTAVKMIADFVKMSVGAVVEAAKATVAWVASSVESAAAWVSSAVPKIIAAFSLTAIKSYIHAADVALAWTINAARVSFIWVTQELPKLIVGFIKVAASATLQAGITSVAWIASSASTAFAWTVTQLPRIIAGFIVTSASAVAQAVIVSSAWVVSSSTSAIAWVVTELPRIIAAFVATSGAAVAQAAIATTAWVASAVTSSASFEAFKLLVSTPMVMGTIVITAALAAIVLVYNAIQSVIGAMNALSGLTGAKNNAISNAQSTIDNAKKEYDAGTINKTQYDKINSIGNSAKSSAEKIDTSFGAQLGGWWNDLKTFSDGGYTGAGGSNDVAGIVHKGEYVVPQNQVDQATGKPKNNTNTTHNSQTVTIQNVYLGSGDAVTKFFNKLDQDSILVGKGLTPNRGAY